MHGRQIHATQGSELTRLHVKTIAFCQITYECFEVLKEHIKCIIINISPCLSVLKHVSISTGLSALKFFLSLVDTPAAVYAIFKSLSKIAAN